MRWKPLLALLPLVLLCASSRRAAAQDEFLVNDDRIDRNQWAPRAALGANGTLLFVWMDGRNIGPVSIDYDIELMSLRDPLGLGSSLNRRVNDDAPGPVQGFPDIASSPSGTFLCVWEDARSGNRDIYAAALDSIGTRIGSSLRVNDDAGSADQQLPRALPIGSDRFLVVWGDGREGQGEIDASYRTAAGAPLGPNRKLSVDPVPTGSFQGAPAAAAGAGGRTLVVWLDGREGGSAFGSTFDVYAQWLDGSGAPIGSNFKINGTTGPAQCATPTVAADSTRGWVVAWIDRRGAPADPGDVYAQRFDLAGAPVGGNVRVNDDAAGKDQRSVYATSGPGAALLVWEDYRGNLGVDANAEGALVPYDAGAPGANFRVNADLGGRQGAPAALWDGRDAFIGAWEDGRNGAPDIFAISFFPDGTRRGSDTQLNDDAAPFDQRAPRLGRGPGRFVAAWTDRRSGSDDLYAQWMTDAGARDGENHLLWRDDLTNRPVAFASAVAGTGRALVAAQITHFADGGDIRGFFYGSPGIPPTSSFWIGDVLPSPQATPSVAAGDSEFAVVWIDGRDGTPRLYGQRISALGAPVGGNHPVLALEPQDPVYALDLASDGAGGYWLAYAEGSSADQRLWLLDLDAGLAPAGAPFPVAPGMPGGRDHPSVGAGNDGRVEVVWLGTGAEGYGHVYHESYGPGILSALDATLVEAESGRPAAGPTLAVAGSGSVVTWGERGTLGDWSVWLQRFDGGAAAGPPLRVDQDLTAADQFDPCAGFDTSGRAVVIWTDFRSRSSGSDILGRSFQFAPTRADDPPPVPEPPPVSAPRATRVGPGRPNPFSSSLAAPVEIGGAPGARVVARVWDARGRLVRTLADGAAAGARFTLRWDGSDAAGRPAASGVYWITVESGGERATTRVVYLR
ncbi:MAG TPA: FlgD immunoglobulin-like domain containing protein [Candidatus Binatia bacterium]|nr:FlgD immunoglobulin-like domain containing protein [Candidatus Binatia bacterium]